MCVLMHDTSEEPHQGEKQMNRFRLRTGMAGFTLIELLLVVAIIGVLAAIAVPYYGDYAKKAKFSEVVAAVNPVRLAVEICVAEKGTTDTDNCDSNTEVGITTADYAAGDNVASIVLDGDGTAAANKASITATAAASAGGYTYILEGVVSSKVVKWTLDTTNSTCYAVGYCR
jgi:type IV pilus assembly protein PilA